jgi:DNA-binding PadR family transcriptional regulator
MSTEQDTPAGLTPLREPTLFILLALSNGRKHGYAILKDVERLSQGRVILSTGTLYGALARLLEQGVIQKSTPDEGQVGYSSETGISGLSSPGGKKASGGTRARKYYQLTRFGRRVLDAEVQRLESLLAATSRELGEQGT